MENGHEQPITIENELLYENRELETREAIFTSIIHNHLIDKFEEDLEEADYSPTEVEQFKESLNSLSPEKIKGVLSIPFELRSNIFEQYRKKVDAGKTDINKIVSSMNSNAVENGFTIGYHLSNIDIPIERPNTNAERAAWSIKGSELDDRDNMLMAYYSLDYRNLFRKRCSEREL